MRVHRWSQRQRTAAAAGGLGVQNVGTVRRRVGATVRSAGDRPICSSTSNAASTTACWEVPGCAAGIAALLSGPLRRAGSGRAHGWRMASDERAGG